ncbi:MAG: hypothetical protein B7X90_03095 [Novosphingobium sp. 17-62-19]|uniref:hypothetical protein n=1 Tax=Novosphingobium sp. 17-62-19 TaxID=1970406 RepID=UPI000BD83EA1|nr:hypothetical protein [Novosphingobium sp. 17-62-19]OZA21112.1 MAG: hypothetical protein B7X90_03095 [Novosphingobium sp. 17-62-19]OZA72726.1 MAG: hypothetical protein B7X78_00445 [Sphingomonadales bacterium 39-62-4]HQS95326.1 hypothetical protein [Novosphingobium sp.]
MKSTSKMLGATSALALFAFGATNAHAAGTTAGDLITNTATISYQVGGIDQNDETASDTLTVDRKINLTVAEVGTATTIVTPGSTSQVTTFTVTNNSNAPLDFALDALQQSGGTAAHGGTDSFTATNVRIYLDNGDNTFDSGSDTLVTFLDEVAADATRRVFVVSDIPLGLANASVAGVALLATGREAGTAASQGAALVQTTGGNTAGMDTVFADVTAGTDDGERDAAHSARDDYTVATATLTVAKTSRIVSDPVNGATNPKMIPGATVEYCIAVSNASGASDAAAITVNDPLPTTVTYDGSFGVKVDGTVDGSGVCLADGATAGSETGGTVSGTIATLSGGATKTVLFHATIN